MTLKTMHGFPCTQCEELTRVDLDYYQLLKWRVYKMPAFDAFGRDLTLEETNFLDDRICKKCKDKNGN